MLVSFQALVKGAWLVYYAAPVPCLKQLARCTDAIIIVLAYAVMHDVEIDGLSASLPPCNCLLHHRSTCSSSAQTCMALTNYKILCDVKRRISSSQLLQSGPLPYLKLGGFTKTVAKNWIVRLQTHSFTSSVQIIRKLSLVCWLVPAFEVVL
jgi:hypothetical protein